MSQSGFTPIQLYRTTTAAAIPTAGNLAAGELGINLTDERLYFKNAAGVVKLLASNSGALGTVTSVDVSGGTTGLTTSGGPITSSGTITLAGTLGVANGGTGTATAFTAGSVVFAGASGVYSQDNANLFWDNTNDRLGIGINTPAIKLQVSDVDQATARIGVRNANGQNYHLVAGTPGASNTGFAIFDATASATRMYISSAGLVGIGTTSPLAGFRLDVSGSANASGSFISGGGTTNQAQIGNKVLLFYNTSVGEGLIQSADDASTFNSMGIDKTTLRFLTNNTERMRITSAGDVGIGITTPGARIAVAAANTAVASRGTAYLYSTNSLAANLGGQLSLGGSFTGTSETVFGSIAGRKENGTDNDIGGYLQFSTTNVALGNVERMRIDSSGNVGIGTGSPAYRLDVSGTFRTTGIAYLGDATTTLIASIGNSASSGVKIIQFQRASGTGDNVNIQGISTGVGAADLGIQAQGGNVGIGTSSPAAKLTVYGGEVQWGASSSLGFLGYTGGFPILGSLGALPLALYTNGSERMRITSAGDVGIGTAAPGATLTLVNGANFPFINWNNSSNTQIAFAGWHGGSGGGGDFRIGTVSTTAFGFQTNNSERMRITSSGTLLINESAQISYGGNVPKLEVLGASVASADADGGTVGIIGSTNTAGAGGALVLGSLFQTGAWATFARVRASKDTATSGEYGGGLAFDTRPNLGNLTQRMLINSEGLVSIGTTATLASLTVSGSGGSGQVAGFRNALYLRHINSSGNQSNFICFGSAGTVTSCFIGNDIQGDGTTINQLNVQAGGSGGVYLASGGTSWTSASDEREKDIIEPISNAAQKVSTLRAVIGKYKTDEEGTRRSFLIAQDVQAVLPEAVNVGTDDQQTLGVAYTDTIPLLVAAIKELTARVAQLEGN